MDANRCNAAVNALVEGKVVAMHVVSSDSHVDIHLYGHSLLADSFSLYGFVSISI